MMHTPPYNISITNMNHLFKKNDLSTDQAEASTKIFIVSGKIPYVDRWFRGKTHLSMLIFLFAPFLSIKNIGE
jgi:hypothetical protein